MEHIDRTEWLQNRKKGIGGSDAAAIIGLNPYMTNVDLWEIKTGRKEQEDISQKPCVLYGTKAEAHLRELFILQYPDYYVENEPYEIYSNIDYPFIRGTFDGIISDGKSGKLGVLEIKTTTIRRKADLEKWDGQIPQNYYCQILHYFLCRSDFEFAILKAELRRDDKSYNAESTGLFKEVQTEIRHYFIDRYSDQVKEDLDYLFEEEKKFWEYVEKDERPALLLPKI